MSEQTPREAAAPFSIREKNGPTLAQRITPDRRTVLAAGAGVSPAIVILWIWNDLLGFYLGVPGMPEAVAISIGSVIGGLATRLLD